MNSITKKAIALRVVHGIVAAYFAACLFYLYYVVFTGKIHGILLAIVITSLAIEGLLVFGMNKGDCPLIHIQRKVGDDKPFFELFMPKPLAAQALPLYAICIVIGLALLLIRQLA